MKILTLTELDEALSRPSESDIAFLRELTGDIAILGASGKMGPSLSRLCSRASDAAGDTPHHRGVAPADRGTGCGIDCL